MISPEALREPVEQGSKSFDALIIPGSLLSANQEETLEKALHYAPFCKEVFVVAQSGESTPNLEDLRRSGRIDVSTVHADSIPKAYGIIEQTGAYREVLQLTDRENSMLQMVGRMIIAPVSI